MIQGSSISFFLPNFLESKGNYLIQLSSFWRNLLPLSILLPLIHLKSYLHWLSSIFFIEVHILWPLYLPFHNFSWFMKPLCSRHCCCLSSHCLIPSLSPTQWCFLTVFVIFCLTVFSGTGICLSSEFQRVNTHQK